jgi:hypothetical protein
MSRLGTTWGFIDMLHSEAGNYDRVIVQELLKEIAQTQQVDLNAKQRFKGSSFLPLIFALAHARYSSGRH